MPPLVIPLLPYADDPVLAYCSFNFYSLIAAYDLESSANDDPGILTILPQVVPTIRSGNVTDLGSISFYLDYPIESLVAVPPNLPPLDAVVVLPTRLAIISSYESPYEVIYAVDRDEIGPQLMSSNQAMSLN